MKDLSNSLPTLVKAEDDIPCKRSTVKPTFTPSIHTNQQLECITLVQWTSAGTTRLTTFKVTRFSSSFSIPACESISTWATLKMFRKVNPGRIFTCRFICRPYIYTIKSHLFIDHFIWFQLRLTAELVSISFLSTSSPTIILVF